MLRRRLLSLAAVAVAVMSAVVPARAQSSFTATGGDVTAFIGGWGYGIAVPLADQFSLVLLDATNTPTATLFTYGQAVPQQPPVALGTIGMFSAGSVFRLGLVALATGTVSSAFTPIEVLPTSVSGNLVLGGGTHYRSGLGITLTGVSAVNDPVEFPPPPEAVVDPTLAPEPASILLLGTGLVAVAGLTRRARRRCA